MNPNGPEHDIAESLRWIKDFLERLEKMDFFKKWLAGSPSRPEENRPR